MQQKVFVVQSSTGETWTGHMNWEVSAMRVPPRLTTNWEKFARFPSYSCALATASMWPSLERFKVIQLP